MLEPKYKSLQESILEFTVMHFRKVFLDSGLITEAWTSKRKILPPFLYERIILKSKEMRWYIPLKDTLKCRDLLSWKNIDVKSIGTICKWKNIWLNMNEVIYPVKSLSIKIEEINEVGMGYLNNMGFTLERLDFTYSDRDTIVFLDAPFPKLKKLCLRNNRQQMDLSWHDEQYLSFKSLHVINLDLSKFSNALEEFGMHNTVLGESSMKSLATLKQLKVLRFRNVPNICHNVHFLEALSSLDQLRSLDLTASITDMPDPYRRQFLAVISKLPSLENCDISFNENIKKDFVLEVMKCRKWKKFGMQSCCDVERNYFSYHHFKPFADQVFAIYDETIFSTLPAYTRQLDFSSTMIDHLIEIFPNIPDDQIPMIENVILNVSELNPYDYSERLIGTYLETGRYTNNFIKQLLNLMCGTCEMYILNEEKIYWADYYGMPKFVDSVARRMFKIVQKDLNKGFARILLMNLYFFVYGHKILLKDKEFHAVGIVHTN